MKIDFKVNDNWSDKVGPQLENALIAVIEKFQKHYVHNLISEIPKDSGKLADDIKTKRPRKIKPGVISATITIGASIPYVWAIWKGLNPDIYSVAPRFSQYMIFPVPERWPQYDGRFGNISYFITSQRLRNNIPPNRFVERAKKKTRAQVQFGKELAKFYNQARKRKTK